MSYIPFHQKRKENSTQGSSIKTRVAERSVEFIWFLCGPNELELKKCIRIYSDDRISIYVHILCIFSRYRRDTKENRK
jgi:hypothetical protein